MSEPLKAMADAVLLIFAAWCQTQIPGFGVNLPGFPLLIATGLVIAWKRPLSEAAVCLLWAGMLNDSIGLLPRFCTAAYLLSIFGVVRLYHGGLPLKNAFQGVLLCGAATSGLVLWTYAFSGANLPVTFVQLLVRCALAFPAGVLSAAVGNFLVGFIDRHSGRIVPENGENGIIWTETNS